MPKRIQRKRTKGWKLPEGAVIVTRPTNWGNPFKVGHHYKRGDSGDGIPRMGLRFIYTEAFAPQDGYTTIRTNAEAVDWYRWYVSTWSPEMKARAQRELGGKDLACWCAPDDDCHVVPLLEIANA